MYSVRCVLSMCHKPFIKSVQAQFGGLYTERKGSGKARNSFALQWTNNRSKPFLEALLPYLIMKREEAESLGAEMEFGVKYPDMVTVYSMGPIGSTPENPRIPEAFSLEFCGGPHVHNTKEISEGGKKFKILKEESVAQGIRRIKAVVA